ncbi:hypothetical protein [Prochlorococcus marinus]|uniref:DUF1269 domain-containing protein n=1 Tax=Prochlorococcus marinus XMU1408 TaxID=2213228 RepID=A0A318QXN6_PROMR|nr:hypothetical protein [Prochlorococcus marinus]MBW3042540.1 hypothetical protein [Prochlorococcus marinus str. XMU1408]PYE01265.1 hypothetical protein DNJ73_07575 [Prochlorococcus marinus XMU1408]
MSTCVIVLKGKLPARELVLKLKEAQTPILNCDLIEPLKNEKESKNLNLEPSEEIFINEANFNSIKLLNPTLARKDRQKTLAIWLVPFGFIAGLSFSQMTELKTFSDMGFPNQFEKLLGGLVGMISGWLGSFFSAGGINQDIDDDLRALRKKSEQGFWLLILELPIEIELPWKTLKEADSLEIITIDKE